MKFRVSLLIALAFVFALAVNTQAAQLVVMGVNTTAVPGEKVFTIGVNIQASDLTKAGVGANPVLGIQNVTFGASDGTGPGINPNGNDLVDIQSVQTTDIDSVAKAAVNHVGPSNKSGPPKPATMNSTQAADVFGSTFFYYGSSTGLLNGIFNSNAAKGTITTNNAADGSGVYAVGPTANLGTTGFVWQGGTGIAGNGGDLDQISMTGTFGPNGTSLTSLIGGSSQITIPLAQILTATSIVLPDLGLAGTGTILQLGQLSLDLSGAPMGSDTPALLNFATGTIQYGVPEPSTFLLAGLGAVGVLLAKRRRK